MEKYIHKVKYYETDKMGITHHSNYVRWMEEARLDFFDQIGLGYKQLEAEGIISPVMGIECDFKGTTTFDDRIEITVGVESFNGVILVMDYSMANAEDLKPVCTGKSRHCFVNRDGRPIILKKLYPGLDARLRELAGG